MEARPLKFVTEACAGEMLAGTPDTLVSRVCTDSRQAQEGDVFFALAGEKFDGHDFLSEVARRGVTAVVIEAAKVPGTLPGCAVIAVDNTRRALGRLAAAYRQNFALPIVGVGGSNGKTTTKELIASVLRQKLASLSSEASFNNDIGVPLTLLRLQNEHQAAVVEVGTNHPGELAPLVKMVQPKFGVITSISREHLEFFGNLDGVAAEEGWLAELLPVSGKLFINGDNDFAPQIIARACAGTERVGFGPTNEWHVSSAKIDKDGTTFRLEAPEEKFSGEYHVNLIGRHQAVNATFAIAIGAELGLSREEIAQGLEQCQAPKMRLQIEELNGVRILDDAYNANADSMIAALEALHDLPCKGRRVAVLGDMGELGDHTESAHAEVGRRAAELGVDQLFVIGKMAGVTGQAARHAGLNRVLEFVDVTAAVGAVKQFVKPGDVLLLKASRKAELERVAELLKAGDAMRKN